MFNFGPIIRKWISIIYNNCESRVMNAGYITNYFKVLCGVRQGCPLSPFIFVIAVEILGLRIREEKNCKGVLLPNDYEAKVSQFAGDTTIIVKDVNSLKQALRVLADFGTISGLELNGKKTKVMWIGSLKQNTKKVLNFKCPKQPIKFLGTYLSYNEAQNYHNNFTLKIRKIDTKLNIWLSRDLTGFGRTLLAKFLGLSQLVYIASMNTVPEGTIQQVQSKLFSFLWKNKSDKIKRSVLYQPFSKGGLNFPCFSSMIKALLTDC